MYTVYENGKPCSEYKIGDWTNDTFNTKREAEIFAYMWAYPVNYEVASKNAPEFELNRPYDLSMCEESILMEIKYASS